MSGPSKPQPHGAWECFETLSRSSSGTAPISAPEGSPGLSPGSEHPTIGVRSCQAVGPDRAGVFAHDPGPQVLPGPMRSEVPNKCSGGPSVTRFPKGPPKLWALADGSESHPAARPRPPRSGPQSQSATFRCSARSLGTPPSDQSWSPCQCCRKKKSAQRLLRLHPNQTPPVRAL